MNEKRSSGAFIAVIIMVAAIEATAQTSTGTSAKSDPGQLVVPPPMMEPLRADGSRCFYLVNKAPYTVNATINTAYFTAADGRQSRKNVNARMKPGMRQEVCTFGPYYNGDRVELVLRSIVPLFSCYTAAQGDINIYGTPRPEGGTKIWAECL